MKKISKIVIAVKAIFVFCIHMILGTFLDAKITYTPS